MSNNIEHIEIIDSVNFGIMFNDYQKLKKKYEDSDNVAEFNIFYDVWGIPDTYGFISVNWNDTDLEWSGEWSGRSFELFLKKILPKFVGSADIVFTFEDGIQSGVRIVNGKITRHEVEMKLGKEL